MKHKRATIAGGAVLAAATIAALANQPADVTPPPRPVATVAPRPATPTTPDGPQCIPVPGPILERMATRVKPGHQLGQAAALDTPTREGFVLVAVHVEPSGHVAVFVVPDLEHPGVVQAAEGIAANVTTWPASPVYDVTSPGVDAVAECVDGIRP